MLEELIVSNLGLIEHAAIEPSAGLVAVTGETGAGKTLLLGALGLLAGDTARKDVVGPFGGESTVQARFSVDGEERVVVRRVSKRGRSKAYIDGMMASVRELSEAARRTVEIVGQHDHLRLMSGSHVRALLDGAFDDDARLAAAEYASAYDELRELRSLAEQLGGDRHSLERELEMSRFQVGEIEAASLVANEDDTLAADASTYRNAASIVEALAAGADALGPDGIEPLMDRVLIALERVRTFDPRRETLAKQALDIATLLADLRTEVAGAAEGMVEDPADLERLERRIAELGDLKRKYGDSVADVIAFGETASQRADELERLLATAADLEVSLQRTETLVRHTGTELSKHRSRVGRRVAGDAVAHLCELGFESPLIEFSILPTEPGPSGSDRVEILFASSTELEPKPVSRVASGGELSRLVLAIRLAAGPSDTAVAAFDEIDAGVGGTAALALGRKLASLANYRQVLCVTHLPQVAAFADTHIVVSRDGDTTEVAEVNGEARIEELSRMLAGMPESKRGREHAAELLATAGADKP